MTQAILKLSGILAVMSFLVIACGGGDVPVQPPQSTAPPEVSFGQPGGPIPPHAFVGTVTVDGAPALDGDVIEFPGASTVTVVATPAVGSVITSFNCGFGFATGDPAVMQTCVFETNRLDFVNITFDLGP